MLDDSSDEMQLRSSRNTRCSNVAPPVRRSSARPYGNTMSIVYPCKHGEPVYCSGCEVRGLADTGRISRHITDDITQ